jgi:cytoskeleton protein RodZ
MMDTLPQDQDKIVEAVTETLPPLSVGKMLREARELQELSIADVAGRIKFAPRQVEALEADDFARLPELAFVRGFVRSYARLLQLDDVALLKALPQSSQQNEFKKNSDEVLFPTAQSARQINVVWLSAALGLAVILAIGVFLFKDNPTPPKVIESTPIEIAPVAIIESAASGVEAASAVTTASTAVAPVIAVASSVSVAPVAIDKGISTKEKVTPPAENQLATKEKAQLKSEKADSSAGGVDKQSAAKAPIHLVFHAESWVDIKDKSGKTIFKQVNEPGSEQWVEGRPPFSLVIGNASGVRLYYEGEKIDLKEYTDIEVARLKLE